MPEPLQPQGLRAWGQSLWDRVTESSNFDPAGEFILVEACRTADIIERLSGALRSTSTQWVSLSDDIVEAIRVSGLDIAEVHLVVNPIIGEIRQQRLALRTLLSQLKIGTIIDGTAPDDPILAMMADFNKDLPV